MAEMKGIKLCGECRNYDFKKHKCRIGCNDDSNAQASFYGDCPLPDVVPKSEVIPCKIGDTVWGITKYSGGLTRKARKSTVSAMFFLGDMRLCIVARSISRGEWGKEIFATQEEAEAAIERCGQ